VLYDYLYLLEDLQRMDLTVPCKTLSTQPVLQSNTGRYHTATGHCKSEQFCKNSARIRGRIGKGAAELDSFELKLCSFSSTSTTITKDGENYQCDGCHKNHNDGNFHSYQQKAHERDELAEQSYNQKNESCDSA